MGWKWNHLVLNWFSKLCIFTSIFRVSTILFFEWHQILQDTTIANWQTILCYAPKYPKLWTKWFYRLSCFSILAKKVLIRKCYSVLDKFWDVRNAKEGTTFLYNKSPRMSAIIATEVLLRQTRSASLKTRSDRNLLLIWMLL